MPDFATRVFATPEAISEVGESLLAFLQDNHVDARTVHHVALIAEEILTNIGTHGNAAHTPTDIAVAISHDAVSGTIVDHGDPFDLTEAADPALDECIEERAVGGLGLFLVRELSDRLTYERLETGNRLRFSVARPAADPES